MKTCWPETLGHSSRKTCVAGVQKPVEKIPACEISKDSDCKRKKQVNMKNMSEKERNDFGEEERKDQENHEEVSHYEKVVFDAQAKLSSDISVDRYFKEHGVISSCLTVLNYDTQPQSQPQS